MKPIQNRTQIVLIISIFLAALGSSALVPVYVFYLTKRLGLSIVDVGILLTFNVVAQRGLALVAGYFVDLLNAKAVMLFGLAVRVASFVLLAEAHSYSLLVVATLLSGTGVALFQTAGKAVLLADTKNVTSSLAARAIALNCGIVLGPMLGYLLLQRSFPAVCMTIAALFCIIALVLSFELTFKKSDSQKLVKSSNGYQFIAKNNRVLALLGLQAGFYFLYSCMDLIFPAYAKDKYSVAIVGSVYMVNAIVVILCQWPAAKLLSASTIRMPTGILFFVASFAVLAISTNFSGKQELALFILAIGIFSLGEVLLMLVIDFEITKEVEKSQLGRAFGASSFAAMLGAALGNIVLGYFFSEMSQPEGHLHLWLMLATLSTLLYLTFRTVDRKLSPFSARAIPE